VNQNQVTDKTSAQPSNTPTDKSADQSSESNKKEFSYGAGAKTYSDSGKENSKTSSALSGGLLITDEEGQKERTGKTAEETIASVSESTSDEIRNHQNLEKNWDGDKLKNKMEADLRKAPKMQTEFIGKIQDMAESAKKELLLAAENMKDPVKREELLAEAAEWAEGGFYDSMEKMMRKGLMKNPDNRKFTDLSYQFAGTIAEMVKDFPDGAREIMGSALMAGVDAIGEKTGINSLRDEYAKAHALLDSIDKKTFFLQPEAEFLAAVCAATKCADKVQGSLEYKAFKKLQEMGENGKHKEALKMWEKLKKIKVTENPVFPGLTEG
jgi:filamentous hemagglutinin